MIVALTGASGFIGSYTAAALKRRGITVRALVRESSRRDHIEPHVGEWVVGEQSDSKAVESLVQGADCVIHSSIDWSASEERDIDNVIGNFTASARILEATRLAQARQFIFVSSAAVLREISAEGSGPLT